MSTFFTFALVVVIIALILLAFSIANLVYFNQFKSGVALTSNQLRTVKALNIIGLILIVVIFIYGIFVAVQAQRSSAAIALALAARPAAPAVAAVPVAAPIAPAAAAPVVAPVAAAAVAVPVAAAPLNTSAPPMNNANLPAGVVYAGRSSDGVELYQASRPVQINTGQYICTVPNR